ncbi:type IV pilus assembly PilZ [Psychromonas ingrahamii 37]|uniref:Type IV pilus assembly PilZ n=1 Tax=Psychromonas ingrahamii (strain DSM 17664 / CCUG 51855 / 37) TaxID=357804 RepID=A1SXG1_PSYIN|nr:PilZ domain-containing protein [Psychromonas ingrahamii]ABM04176.1 type IV pilus assembly PilZ [Psychromonas ingrahamii 37]
MKEKREFPRVQHIGSCILSREGATDLETWQTKILDITAQGASIECPDTWPGLPDDNVRMTLTQEGGDIELKLSGMIVHQRLGVLGIKFLTVSVDNLAHLQRIIELDIANKIKTNESINV